ncbi:poly-beta-1,6 N-acetyl-D-glucosamine export porin PgaA [Roseomonas sp. PWR1]|uniref:Poly-beta-1,6 N-acetyl-D-glucosamine export porin PgaA n=1 Tax=Roseomonas nitratireducens TaxID=2820810 RepID=A0ABS4AXN8_9PROT|nr:poly-beta-1,6 N-acetyl-D-glucosamine export porin PgaA [Neoroseomonas nitratireducens]MBP0466116.1 poly-beta-1,6 N-acetyl-D-glucosamine export porin PgaA [Neoroseomonas nitratireducens]
MGGALAQDPAALREAGVVAARAGRLDEGIALLERARTAAPADRGTLADLVVVLSWAGRDREALARFATLGEANAPAYAVAAAAVSARRSGQAARAAALYRRAIAAGETGLETRLGLALAEAARGDAAAARAALAEAEAAAPGSPRIRQVAAEIERATRPDPAATAARVRATAGTEGAARAADQALAAAQGASPDALVPLADTLMDLRRPFDALLVAQRGLRAAPGNRDLRRREALALAAIGAPELALVRNAATPGILTPAEERRIRSAATAFLVRWGGQVESPTPRDPAARHARTDAALAALDAAIAAWTPLGPEAAGAVRNARLDRLAALRARGRMEEVVAEAEALGRDAPLPAYAREPYADALLELRRPEDAEAEYRAVLEADPGALEPTLGLFYALSEQRRWRDAREVADRLARDVPTYRPVRGPEPPAEEYDRIEAVRAGILWRMWGDDLAGAEAEADPLAANAAMNASLRATRGDIWRLRGWHDRALEEYETALTNEANALDLRIGRATALFERRRWAEAREAIGTLAREYPENDAVRRLARRLEVHDMREFEASVRGGLERGSSDPELDVTARLWSAPIAENWRVFSGARLRTGETNGGSLTTYRLLAGVEWRGSDLVVTGGASIDREGVNRGGAFLSAAWRLSDHWSIEALGEISAGDTPLAALRAGIYADAAQLGLAWRISDLREAAVSARVVQFSDDNTRLIGFARVQERVMNLPDWKLDLQPYAYGTRNSQAGGPYFNPESDLEVGVTAALTWIAWRRYERDLRVRLIGTGGGYWQEGFGWSPLFALRWENEHRVSDTFSVSYGAGWVRRDYDGVTEDAGSVTGALRWRF